MMNIFSFLRDEAVKKESWICEGLCKMAKTFFHGGIRKEKCTKAVRIW